MGRRGSVAGHTRTRTGRRWNACGRAQGSIAGAVWGQDSLNAPNAGTGMAPGAKLAFMSLATGSSNEASARTLPVDSLRFGEGAEARAAPAAGSAAQVVVPQGAAGARGATQLREGLAARALFADPDDERPEEQLLPAHVRQGRAHPQVRPDALPAGPETLPWERPPVLASGAGASAAGVCLRCAAVSALQRLVGQPGQLVRHHVRAGGPLRLREPGLPAHLCRRCVAKTPPASRRQLLSAFTADGAPCADACQPRRQRRRQGVDQQLPADHHVAGHCQERHGGGRHAQRAGL